MKSNIHPSNVITPHLTPSTPERSPGMDELDRQLNYLRLPTIRRHAAELSRTAVQNGWDPLRYLATLVDLETCQRRDRSAQKRVSQAKFPVIKTMDTFDWNWPASINRPQIEALFDLRFIEQKANVLFFGNPGLGKSHIATALGYSAALAGHQILFANTIEVVNRLHSAVHSQTLTEALRYYAKPALLVLDELGFLPLDQRGGDLLFQVISQRYERGSIILTSNKVPNQWASVFNNDAALASAILDRLSHHCQTVVIEGNSYRMRPSDV